MRIAPSHLLNLKESLLVVTVLYFFGLAVALQFHTQTYGMDSPLAFLIMGSLFLIALGLEAVLAWWDTKIFLLWTLLWVLSYAVIGLYAAPLLYGQGVLVYVYVEPIVVVFIGGFAYVFSQVIAEAFFPQTKLSRDQLHQEQIHLPGWSIAGNRLKKTFTFEDFVVALNFVNLVARIAADMHHHPEIDVRYNKVTVTLSSKEVKGVTKRDVLEARKIDAIGM